MNIKSKKFTEILILASKKITERKIALIKLESSNNLQVRHSSRALLISPAAMLSDFSVFSLFAPIFAHRT